MISEGLRDHRKWNDPNSADEATCDAVGDVVAAETGMVIVSLSPYSAI